VRILAEATMAADEHSFHIAEKLSALLGDERVFELRRTYDIPRDLA
jgi:hypothetical protein